MSKDPLNDGISKVELIDYMGDDTTVVNAARVSMGKQVDTFSDKDAKLITYLATHGHWTPFSQPQIQLRIKMPIFIARQWFKHQVGFTRNEVSRRYVSDAPEVYVPKEWRRKPEGSVKQGSSDETVREPTVVLSYQQGPWYDDEEFDYEAMCAAAVKYYNTLLDSGICPEQARMVLPQSMYTEFVETGSLAAHARLAKLRLDPHAQKEIQWYAQAVSELIEPLFPVSWTALTK